MPCFLYSFPPRVRTRTETPSDSTGPASASECVQNTHHVRVRTFFFYACGGHGNRSLQRSAGGGWKRWLRAGRKGETRALRRPHTTCVETPVENSQGSWEGASVTNEYTTCRQATHTLCVAASMWTDWPPRAHQCRDAVLTCIVTGGGWREGREERAIAPNPCTSPRPCL